MGGVDEQTLEAIANCGTLDELAALAESYEGFTFFDGLQKAFVFGSGDPHGGVMFIGDAPTAADALAGYPFAGPAGALLGRMARLAGLPLERHYVTNLAYTRPIGGRPLLPWEIASCVPFMRRHIDLCQPKMLICLGGPPARALLDLDGPLLGTAGDWRGLRGLYDYETRDGNIPAYVTYHPEYLLRERLQKQYAYHDLLNAADVLVGKRIPAQMVRVDGSPYARAG